MAFALRSILASEDRGLVRHSSPWKSEYNASMRFRQVACAIFLYCVAGAAQTGQIQLLRSLSGPSGKVDGNTFILDETRTRFVYPRDKSLVVYFEWDAPPGNHVLTAVWKAPDGRAVSLSEEIRLQTPNRELRAYWTFALTSSMASGIWTVEVRANGQPAGSHVFEVSVPDTPAPASLPAAPIRPVQPSLEEVYKTTLRSMVWVHRLDSSGRRTDSGSGFITGKDRIATAFQNIDAASGLEVEFADGRLVRTTDIWAAHRIQDWAVIRADTQEIPALERDQSSDTYIGERLIVLNVENDRTRAIGGVDITGRHDIPGFQSRIQLSPGLSTEAAGGPLLTPFGKVTGIIGASQAPGARFEQRTAVVSPGLWTGYSAITAATPITLIAAAGTASSTNLQALATAGILSAPLFLHASFTYGGITNNLPRDANAPILKDVTDFSRQDPAVFVYTWWQKRDKANKGTISAKVYDAQNRLRVQSKPMKATIQDSPTRFSISFSPAKLERGIYRVDVTWQDQAVWRTFFSIVD
jgi:S1-C subfamily serine protease